MFSVNLIQIFHTCLLKYFSLVIAFLLLKRERNNWCLGWYFFGWNKLIKTSNCNMQMRIYSSETVWSVFLQYVVLPRILSNLHRGRKLSFPSFLPWNPFPFFTDIGQLHLPHYCTCLPRSSVTPAFLQCRPSHFYCSGNICFQNPPPLFQISPHTPHRHPPSLKTLFGARNPTVPLQTLLGPSLQLNIS